jgi:catechol-2,3-dioxygenase
LRRGAVCLLCATLTHFSHLSKAPVPILALNHINLRAEQGLLEQLRAFYVDVVGLQVGEPPSLNFPGYWLYLEGQAVLHLVADSRAPRSGEAKHGTFDHIAFSCTDMPAFETRLKNLGIPYRRSFVPNRTVTQLFVTDPSGNGVEFNFDETGT